MSEVPNAVDGGTAAGRRAQEGPGPAATAWRRSPPRGGSGWRPRWPTTSDGLRQRRGRPRLTPFAGLRLDEVTVRFGTTTALESFNLDVTPGEVVAILGPSGCGKSTLLRAVAGLQPIQAGTISWAGEDLTSVPVHERGFGLMFQDGQLFVHRNVGGNVAFGLEMTGVAGARRRARVAELLETVGLEGYERRTVTTLSGGEQQRVALARALAPDPRLLLLDEPLTSLDRMLRERLSRELADILRQTGTTALYVTHDHDEAFAVADRIAVMSDGKLLQVDTPAAMWRRPASLKVAAFLGYETFLPGSTDEGAPALIAVAHAGAHVVSAAAPESDGGAEGEVAEGSPSLRILGGRTLGGVVVAERISRGGPEVDVALDVPAGQVMAARVSSAGSWPAGSRVALELDPAATVVLPIASRVRTREGTMPSGYDRRP